jgi:hypothetical protein
MDYPIRAWTIKKNRGDHHKINNPPRFVYNNIQLNISTKRKKVDLTSQATANQLPASQYLYHMLLRHLGIGKPSRNPCN